MSRNVKEALVYLIPSIILFLVFFYWPLIQNIYLSFFSWNMVSPTMKYVGFKNFADILSSPELIKIMINTVLFIGFMLILIFVLPYFYSYILGHLIKKWNNFYRSALFLPATLSLAVASILFLWIYNPLEHMLISMMNVVISLSVIVQNGRMVVLDVSKDIAVLSPIH